MEAILIPVCTFLLGLLVSALWYTAKFAGELVGLKTEVKNLSDLIKKPLVIPESLIEKLTDVCTRAKDLEKRVDRLERGG